MSDIKLAIEKSHSNTPGTLFHKMQAPPVSNIPFTCGTFILQPGTGSMPHQHLVTEIWIISSGTGIFTYNDEKIRVTASDYLFIEPMSTHTIYNDGDGDLIIYALWWE